MSAHPFVVHVAKLRRTPGTRWHEIRSGAVQGLDCSGSAVPEGTEVEADVVLESVVGGIAVSGIVCAAWSGACRRCLEPASGTLRVRVLEHFTEGGDGSDTYPLVDDEIDLEPMIHDVVVLELPQAPLCREACRGLCPTCGVNRNEERCDCDRAATDPRWAALAALRFDDRRSGEPPDR